MKKDIMVIRESIGRIVSMLTNRSIAVTQRGSRAFVSYHPKTGVITSVNIPYIPDDASDEFVAAIQGFLDHEVGHVLFSDFAALKIATKEGKRTANLANIIEDVFVERKMSEAFRGSGANLEAVRKFYLEKIAGVKIKEALARGETEEARGYATVAAFRGWGGQTTAADFCKDPVIAKLVEPVAEKLGPDLIEQLGQCNSSMECLDLARKCKAKLETPKPPPPPPPPPREKDMLDAMDSKDDLADSLEDEDKDEPEDEGTSRVEDDDSGKTGSEESDAVEDSTSKGETAGDSAGDKEESEDETDTEAEGDDEPADKADEFGDEGEPDEAGDGDEDESAGMGTDADEGDTDTGSEEPGEADEEGADAGDSAPADADEGAPGESEPEGEPAAPELDPLADMFDTERDFDKDMGEVLSKDAAKELSDSNYAIFSAEWDKIEPAPLARGKNAVKQMEDSIKDQVGVMQKQLERAIAAQHRKAWNPGQRRGRIAPGSLFKVAAGDDRVFRKRTETIGKATAVQLVVDCSGSMSGSNIILAGTASFALSSVLERLKINHEVIGFTSTHSGEMVALMKEDASSHGKSIYDMGWGRIEPIYMPVFKPFSGKLDAAARSRIAHLTEVPGWLTQNIDGESIKIAAHRLTQQRAERHIMIVLSDGEPCCQAGRGLGAHLKKTVKELEKSGVEVIGIGIQTTAVKSFYSKSLVLNDIATLPTTVMAELTKLLLAK